jgi:hypothetical protein
MIPEGNTTCIGYDPTSVFTGSEGAIILCRNKWNFQDVAFVVVVSVISEFPRELFRCGVCLIKLKFRDVSISIGTTANPRRRRIRNRVCRGIMANYGGI